MIGVVTRLRFPMRGTYRGLRERGQGSGLGGLMQFAERTELHMPELRLEPVPIGQFREAVLQFMVHEVTAVLSC